MQQGVVKFFNDEKGWGFISPEGGGDELFVHYSGIDMAGRKTLAMGDRVTFDSERTERGLQARNVRIAG